MVYVRTSLVASTGLQVGVTRLFNYARPIPEIKKKKKEREESEQCNGYLSMSIDDASHYEVTRSRGRKGRKEKNGASFERGESCGERLVAAWQRFRLVDDGIFNENRRPLVGRKQGGTT